MRSTFFTLLLMLSFTACKKRQGYNVAEIEKKLSSTFQKYLYTNEHTDSTKIRYDVMNINYFDDTLRNHYVCEFTIHMHVSQNNFDTVGMMKAYITKDFKKVNRLY